eukprot:CAMPEP_0204617780 /NCGR_PEP_ID=MMETSP0717-20131115/4659_1 /ASSEMBLY_ACC=CAM_ASM_000666 /TAXON_ID=230516 /ORGANISM="Chaetoceros curvisetus" /LENGTH=418 /DNA_ID=CAMNT_0051631403 /DNA_START=103 /DNA_END=1356 /DNA_ORIENTATION=+
MKLHCSVESFFGCHDQKDDDDDDGDKHDMDGTYCCTRKLRRGLWADDDYEVAERIVRHFHFLNESTAIDRSTRKTETDEKVNVNVNIHEVKIPNMIHFIWLGPKELPSYPAFATCEEEHSSEMPDSNDYDNDSGTCNVNRKWNETMASWKLHHPEWEIKLWNDKHVAELQQDPNQPECSAKLNQLYHHCMETTQYGMASDIARLQILYAHGGIYADIDYVCVRSLQDLNENGNENDSDSDSDNDNAYDFYCGASNTGCIEMNNGLIGSIPHHFFIQTLMQRIAEWDNTRTCSMFKSTSVEDQVTPNQATFSLLSSFLDKDTLSSLQSSTKAVATTTAKRYHFKPMEVIEHTGPGLLTRELLKLFQDESMGCQHQNTIAIMPSCTFNAVPNTHRRLLKPNDEEENEALMDHKDKVQDIL